MTISPIPSQENPASTPLNITVQVSQPPTDRESRLQLFIKQLGAFTGGAATIGGLLKALTTLSEWHIGWFSLMLIFAAFTIAHRQMIAERVSSVWLLVLLIALIGISPFAVVLARVTSRSTPLDAPPIGLGIKQVYLSANDFLPELATLIDQAASDITFAGVSFYITLPQHKDRLLIKLQAGVRVRLLIYDCYSPNVELVAAGFRQTPLQLRAETLTTLANIKEIKERAKAGNMPGAFEVRLFRIPLGSRFYIFDKADEKSLTFFIPHVNGQNSPNSPGLLANNIKGGVAARYFEGIESSWAVAEDLDKWLAKNDPANNLDNILTSKPTHP